LRNRRQKIKGSKTFILDVPAGVKGYVEMNKENRECFVADGSISKVKAMFYPGQENTLLLMPVLMDSQNSYDEIIDTAGDRGKGNICGENEVFETDVDLPFQKGDWIRVYYENNNTVGETYTLKLTIEYNYEGGELYGRA
jgi:hypothetical protein